MAKKKSPPVSRKNKSSAAKKAAVTRKAKPSAQKNHAPTGINIIKKDGAKVEVAKSQQFTMPPQIDVSDGKARTALVTSWASNPKDAKIKHFEDDVWTVKTYDAEPKIEADYTGHIFKMDAIEDNSIDALWCQQIMQRYYMPHVLEALKEFKRVMRDDALLYINVPDGQLAAAHLAHENFYKPLYETPAGPITAVDIVYGYQKAILAMSSMPQPINTAPRAANSLSVFPSPPMSQRRTHPLHQNYLTKPRQPPPPSAMWTI